MEKIINSFLFIVFSFLSGCAVFNTTSYYSPDQNLALSENLKIKKDFSVTSEKKEGNYFWGDPNIISIKSDSLELEVYNSGYNYDFFAILSGFYLWNIPITFFPIFPLSFFLNDNFDFTAFNISIKSEVKIDNIDGLIEIEVKNSNSLINIQKPMNYSFFQLNQENKISGLPLEKKLNKKTLNNSEIALTSFTVEKTNTTSEIEFDIKIKGISHLLKFKKNRGWGFTTLTIH